MVRTSAHPEIGSQALALHVSRPDMHTARRSCQEHIIRELKLLLS